MRIENGQTLFDTDGKVLHAHGGFMLQVEDTFYWYGENRQDHIYVSCYASKDLVNWTFRNHILTTETKTEAIRVRTDLQLKNENGRKVNIERPKVIYNQRTKKYVLWAHYENGEDYLCAAVAVATCDTPDGDFTYHGSFNPYGEMSRDCTLYQEEDGTAYFLSAARDNADMHIYRLQDDYLNVDSLVNKLWQGEYREAPALFKKDGFYYMLSSFCTGWAPNQGKYGTASDIEGKWSSLQEFGDKTTYHSQPAFVLTIKGTKKTSYIYVGDRWGGDGQNYFNSTYVFLPLNFQEGNRLQLEYHSTIKIDVVTGEVEV
ncbi:family 43 glycosylhydrolase [Alicyclobacillus fodiniaquatilis]|uniref:Family 43 glycosylhydrolase n=1 Tax=Alicyclobacillus fodiniaquatilis TaxID=1661150 RepID=A0ABW4JLY0_9BACL